MSKHTHRSRSWVSLTNERLIHNQRLRLAIVNMIVLTVIWGILSLFVYTVVNRETHSSVDMRLEKFAFHVVSQQMFFSSPLPPVPSGHSDQDISFSVWISWEGHSRLLQGSQIPTNLLTKLSTLASAPIYSPGFSYLSVGGADYRIYQLPIEFLNQKLMVQTFTDVGPELDVLERLLLLFLFSGGVSLILTAVGGYALGMWTLRPLMKAREREKEFVADVSHELRTPLSVMQTNLELLLRHVDETNDESLEWVEPLYKETIRMRKMVDELLDMAKIDAGMSAANFSVFTLSEVCQEVAKLYEPVFLEREIDFQVEIAEGLQMFGDQTRIRQLLFILLDNANKYTKKGKVAIIAGKKGGALEILIEDTGIGIPPDLLPRVTQRFFRVDLARTQNVEDGQGARRKNSAGLGMAIAKQIVEAHNGKLIISSIVNKGTSMQIRFMKNARLQRKNAAK